MSVALLPLPARFTLGARTPLCGPLQLTLHGPVPVHWVQRLLARWRQNAGWPLLVQMSVQTQVQAAHGRGADEHWVGHDVQDLAECVGEVSVTLGAPAYATNDLATDDEREGESYALRIVGTQVELSAPQLAGLHCGLQTLLQLVDATGVVSCDITDAPRFGWRGVMLDPARHFLSVGDVLRTLDGMAALKLNVLHLHLSDDQGFRVESKVFPRLSGFGGGGQFYRQSDIQQIIRHARELGIRVVPELDMPGHCQSWLVGYPELAPLPQTWQLRRQFGIGRGSLDPTREETYEFIDALLGEMAALFPDPCLHIGGDEVHPKAWRDVPHISAFMAAHGMADYRALQGYFTRRVNDILVRHGKRSIGWDEVLAAPVSDKMIVQGWRGGAFHERALGRGCDLIVSSGYYFDLFYPAALHYSYDPDATATELIRWEDTLGEGAGFEGVTKTVAAMFRYTRTDAADNSAVEMAANDAPRGRVLGGEACLWGELVTGELLDLRLFSRLTALAERLWSPATVTDVDDFYARHESVLARLSAQSGLRLQAAHALSSPEDRNSSDALRRQTLFDAIEPVKWYARLLGPDLLASRALGEPDPPLRPYDTATPLQRIADRIAPESLAARSFAVNCRRWLSTGTAQAREELLSCAERWVAQARQCEAVGPPAQCENLVPLVHRLGELGGALREALNGRHAQIDTALTPPCEDVFLIVERPALQVIAAIHGGQS